MVETTAPALTSLEKRIQSTLDSAGFTGIVDVKPAGKSETDFAVTFEDHPDADVLSEIEKLLEVLYPDDKSVVVRVPVAWMDDQARIDAAAEAKAESPAPIGIDAQLDETARLIKDLRQRNAALCEDRDTQKARADKAQADAEKWESLYNSAMADTPVAPRRCVDIQFVSFAISQPERVRDLILLINTGWRVAYEQIMPDGKTYLARLERGTVQPSVSGARASARVSAIRRYAAHQRPAGRATFAQAVKV